MQDYLIIKGQIDLIKNATTPIGTKPEEWKRQDRIARAIIQMHLSESVNYMAQSCTTIHALWKMLLGTYEKKAMSFRHLYNLRVKESSSITAHLSAYGSLIMQLS